MSQIIEKHLLELDKIYNTNELELASLPIGTIIEIINTDNPILFILTEYKTLDGYNESVYTLGVDLSNGDIWTTSDTPYYEYTIKRI